MLDIVIDHRIMRVEQANTASVIALPDDLRRKHADVFEFDRNVRTCFERQVTRKPETTERRAENDDGQLFTPIGTAHGRPVDRAAFVLAQLTRELADIRRLKFLHKSPPSTESPLIWNGCYYVSLT